MKFCLQIFLLESLRIESKVLTSTMCNKEQNLKKKSVQQFQKHQKRQMRFFPSVYFLAYYHLPELFGLIYVNVWGMRWRSC
jgi:hypothetical protein